MNLSLVVRILEEIQEEDKAFHDQKEYGSWCSECKRNTAVGLYPFWNRYARELCSRCGSDYTATLKALGALDESISGSVMHRFLADTERLDWLEKQVDTVMTYEATNCGPIKNFEDQIISVQKDRLCFLFEKNAILREAIDAAMSSEKEGGE